jgi:hypothetical protein
VADKHRRGLLAASIKPDAGSGGFDSKLLDLALKSQSRGSYARRMTTTGADTEEGDISTTTL